MKRSRLITYVVLIASVLVVLLAAHPLDADLAADPLDLPSPKGFLLELSARGEVEAAWQRATEVGVYHYTSEIVQTTWPLPKLENVGLSSTTERMYVEGETNVADKAMRMKLWAGGGNTVTGENGIEIRVEEDRAWGRIGTSNWQELEEDVTDLFAPGRDPLAYLAGAKDIVKAGTETRQLTIDNSQLTIEYTRYTFNVDGPAFARHMRDQMEAELIRKGELPPGLHMDVARVYVDMTGEGEIWVDSDGLPLRLALHVKFPPDHLEWVEADITTDFRFTIYDLRFQDSSSSLQSPISNLQSPISNPQSLMPVGLFSACLSLVALLILCGNSKKLYAALAIALIVSMVITPLLQSHHAYAFYEKQSAARAQAEQKQDARQAQRKMETDLLAKDFDPHKDPLASEQVSESANQQLLTLGQDESAIGTTQYAAHNLHAKRPISNLQSTTNGTTCGDEWWEYDDGADTDGDGLTDKQEVCSQMGTDPEKADTDGDGLSDGVEVVELGLLPIEADSDNDGINDGAEVRGFEDASGKQWYLDPSDADSNSDRQPDSLECFATEDGELEDCPDTDGDGTPDVFDFDDDEDGVPDELDSARTTVMGELVSETLKLQDRAFEFELHDLQVDKPVYVDFQLRPTNPDHLWYTLNVLDWPSGDKEGQMQRVHDTTFGESGKDANGDMRLIPLLEIEIPFQAGHYGNLPVKAGAPEITTSTPITAWLDTGQTKMFAIGVRKKNQAGDLVVYVPLTLVEDRGNRPVAFGARMFYRPSVARADGSGLAEAGKPQKARLVWLIQANRDTCTPPSGQDRDTYCENDDNWIENEGVVIHSYYDDWYLTGLSVREDHGLDVGIAFEDPDFVINQGYDPATHYDAHLWNLAFGLDKSFIAGRDQDGDGQRDLTIEGIQARFDRRYNQAVPEDDRWSIPQQALVVETYTFTHQSYIAHIPMTATKQILSNYFMGVGDQPKIQNPTLLFLREETFRSVSLDMSDTVIQHSATKQGGLLATNRLRVSLDPDSVSETSLVAMNWAPYRHLGAGVWEQDSIDEYVAKLRARLRPGFEADSDFGVDASVVNGALVVATSFYLTLFAGLNTVVQMQDTLLETPAAQDDVEISYAVAKGLGAVAKMVVMEIAIQAARLIKWFAGLSIKFRWTGWADELIGFLKATGDDATGMLGSLSNLWKGKSFLGKLGPGLLVVGALVGVGLVSFILAVKLLKLDMPLVDYIISGISIAMYAYSIVSAIKTLVTVAKAGWDAVVKVVNTVTRASIVAAIIGLIVTAIFAIGFFVWGVISGGVEFFSLAFDKALANLAGTLVVAILMTLIALIPIVGAIITAIIGLIDSVIALGCLIAGEFVDIEEGTEWWQRLLRNYVCPGITGLLVKLATFLMYSQVQLVDLQAKDRMNLTNFQMGVTDPTRGMVVGNKPAISADVVTTLYRNLPINPYDYQYIDDFEEVFGEIEELIEEIGWGWIYFWQWFDNYIDDSTFRYAFVPEDKQYLQVETGQMESEWQPASTWGVWSFADFKRFTTTQRIESSRLITFTQAGLDIEIPIYMEEGYAIYAQECIIVSVPVPPAFIPVVVCWLRDDKGDFRIYIGDNFKFDIFPATLDDFYVLAERGDRSYALAWDERFPILADADGDGLRSQALGGDDPDDSSADSDRDGVSDFFEIQHGLDPFQADGDRDGLVDYWELFYHTAPLRADTDADGLTDKEEVDGWEFVYAFDELDEPLITLVSSDPLEPDSDGDGLTDKLEKVYGYNPRVYSELDVLAVSSNISDQDGVVLPGATLVYTATIENNLRDRYALGLLEVDFPLAVQNVDVEPRVYTLPPRQQATLDGQVTVSPSIAHSQQVSLTNRAGANIANLRGEAGGRILWLHLDEDEGATRFIDDSLNGHDATCSITTTCPAAGAAGYAGLALQFDGVDDYASLGNPSNLPSEGLITLAAWIKPVATDGLRNIIAHGHALNPNGEVFLRINAGKYEVGSWGPPGTAYASFAIPAGDTGHWVHLAGVYDGSYWRLYRNGIQVAEAPTSLGAVPVNANWAIGARGDGTERFFEGYIDEVEIYPRALSAEEIAARFKDPVFHAKFDETQYTLVQTTLEAYLFLGDDSSPNQNAIKCDPLAGTPPPPGFPPEQIADLLRQVCPTLGASAPLGKGLTFDKDVPYPLSSGPSASLDLSSGRFSQALWIYPQATTDHPQGVLGYSPQVHDPDDPATHSADNYPSRYAYPSIFIVDQTKLWIGFGDGSRWQSFTTDSLLALNKWNHVVVTYDDGVYKVYINGQEKASHAFGAGVRPAATTQFEIGRGTHCAAMRDQGLHCYKEQTCDGGDCTWWRAQEFRGKFEGRQIWYHSDVDAGEDHAHDVTRNYCRSGGLSVYEDDPGGDEFIGSYYFDFYEPSAQWKELFEGGVWWEGTTSVDLNLTHINPSIPFKGKMDDLAIYRRTLSPEEVQDLYQSASRILEIRFDEAPGRDVFQDYSGNGHIGTCDYEAGACPDSGLPARANQAVRFDGVDDYVTLPDLGSQERLVVGMWVNVATLPQTGTLVSLIHHDGWNAAGQVHMHLQDDGQLQFSVNSNNPPTYESTFTFTNRLNTWVHLAYVYDSLARTFALYVNGQRDGEMTYTTAHPAILGPGRLGSWDGFSGQGERWFKGLIDHVVVLRESLDEAGVRDMMNEVPALSLHLDESVDSTTFGNIADPGLSGGCVISPTETECGCPQAGAKGQMRQAAVFSGLLYDNDASQCIAVPSSGTPASFTVGGWFRPTKRRWTGDQQLIRKVGSYELSIMEGTMKVKFDVTQSSLANVLRPQAVTSIASTSSLLPNQWNQVMATYDYDGVTGEGVMTLYINGHQEASGVLSWAPGQNNNPINIGKSFAGLADEVVIYNTALDRRAVDDLYQYQAAWYDTSASHDITVDVDDPTVRLDLHASHIANRDIVMAIVATDTTSLVTQVEYKVNNGEWFTATRDQEVWLFTFIPPGEGRQTIHVRATDSVGHTALNSKAVTVDGIGPTVNLDLGLVSQVLAVTDSLRLNGMAWDLPVQAGMASGLSAVYVNVLDGRGASVSGRRTATITGTTWTVDYPFAFPPNGHYTVQLEAVDNVGNVTRNPQSPIIRLDGTPPFADITGSSGERYVLSGTGAGLPVITGTVSEVPYPTNPVLHLHLEEGAGATQFHDGSKYQDIGTCAAGTCPSAGLTGQWGRAARFDGGDVINLGRSIPVGTLPQSGEFSVMAWVNLSSTSGLQQILSAARTASPGNGFGFGVKGDDLLLDAYGVRQYETTNVTLTTGVWTHVAVVMAPSDSGQEQMATFYVNGLAQQTITHTVPVSVNLDDDTLVGVGFNGLLDEVAAYDRALDASEIQAIAQPAAAGVAFLDIGFLHVKDMDNPDSISWRPVSLDQAGEAFSTWHYTVPAGLEGPYQVYLRATDNFSQSFALPNVWQGDIDTQAPSAQLVHYVPRFPGDRDIYWCQADDFNLTSLDYACPVPDSQAAYQDAAWYTTLFSQTKLYRYQSPPALVQNPNPADALTACDLFGACTSVNRTTHTETWPVGVVILTPTTQSVFTTTDPIEISGQAYAQAGLQDLTVTANGQSIHTANWGPGTPATSWTTTFTPTSDGAYTLLATIHDQIMQVITSAAPIAGNPGLETVIYVDRSPPQISITTDRVTTENFDNGHVRVRGQVNEGAGISRLQARLDPSTGSGQASGWQDIPHTFQPGWQPWSVFLYVGSLAPPDGQTYTLTARVTDVASNTALVTEVVPADAAPPAAFDVTLAYTNSSGVDRVIRPGVTIYDVLSPTLRGTWTASVDSSGPVTYHVEWVEHLTQTRQILQSSDVSDPRAASFAAGEAQKLSLQVTARDFYDNQTVQTFGPFYVDYEQTPAYIGLDATGRLARPPYRGWLEAPCNLLGTDNRIALKAPAGAVLHEAQKLYSTWDAQGLRLTWTGADWDGDGDLFVYLDTADGGSVRAYNPYSTVIGDPAGRGDTLLPTYRIQTTTHRLAADYLVWVRSGTEASLLEWNEVAGDWGNDVAWEIGDWDYVFDANLQTPHTDLYVPFSTLGISNPVSASLSLVAFATEEDVLRVWAAMPPDNPVNSLRVVDTAPDGGRPFALTHRYGWEALASGVCPRDGRFVEPHVEVSLAAEPAKTLPGESVGRPAGIVYSLLGNELPASVADELAALIGWDALGEEPCLSHPEYITCTQKIDTGSRIPFDAQAELARLVNVDTLALGHGRQVTYTLRLANRGSAPATGVVAHVDTWGPLRLPAGTCGSDPVGEYCSIETEPITLTAGGVYTKTFTGQIDINFDPTHNQGWGTLDVVVFDDTAIHTQDANGRDVYEYPVDWLYSDHEIDQAAPDYVEIQDPPGLIGAGQTTLGGVVYDQSVVPTITLDVKDPGGATTTTSCQRSTPDGDPAGRGDWSCAVDVGAADEGDRFEIRAQASDVYGQVSGWFGWQPFVVDTTPPTLTLSSATVAALADGFINAAETAWSGQLFDNRLPRAVNVCNAAACSQADVTLDAETLPKTLYTYNDQAAQSIGACGSGATSIPITVTDNFTVADVDVGLAIDHPFRDDVEAHLVAPSGISVTLLRAGGDAANFDVLLDDATAVSIRADTADHNTAAPHYDNQRRPYDLLSRFNGEASQGMWHLVICDTRPGESDGAYRQSRLILRAYALPVDATATWRHSLSAAGADGIELSRTLHAVDSVGNPITSPISLTFKLDTVPPVITVTSALTEGIRFYLSGAVSDGGGVRTMRLSMLTPGGDAQADVIVHEQGQWTYIDSPMPFEEGIYMLWVEAEDQAGNQRIAGPFELEIRLPVPTITGVRPSDGETNVARNAPIVVDFSTILLTDTVTTLITPTVVFTPTWNDMATRMTLRHELFITDTRYTVTITGGTGLAGKPLENAPYTWVFTTGAYIAREVDLALDKARVGLGDVTAGGTVTYTFTITNNGPTTLTAATLVDYFNDPTALASVSGDGCDWTPGSEVVTCTLSNVSTISTTQLALSVTTNRAYEGILRNIARIEPLGEEILDPNPNNDYAEPVVVNVVGAVREADLALGKARVGAGDVDAGETITYTFTITNQGPITLTTAVVTDTFNDPTALVSASGDGCGWTPGLAVVTCTLSSVSTVSPTQLALYVTTNRTYAGVLSNTARIEPMGGVVDPNPDNDFAGPVLVNVVPRVYGIYLPLVVKNH